MFSVLLRIIFLHTPRAIEAVQYNAYHPTQIHNKEPFCKSPTLYASNAILNKLTRIHDYILKKVDLPLYERLHTLDIYPQMYGMLVFSGAD